MRYALRGLFALVLLVALTLAAGFFYLRSSLPRLSGALELPGLGAPVEVLRDANGVPHIYAANQPDAYFALGVVHAQDRLFQMEFQRRVGAGRLSEVLGEATLSTDRFLRTLSVYHYAEASATYLDAETLDMLEAYVAGVNAFLGTRRGALPPEFLLLGFAPEPWTVPDVLVWGKMMAWDLGGNWSADLLRARLFTALTPDQVADLYPPVPGGSG
jgi:penicillin G amidase